MPRVGLDALEYIISVTTFEEELMKPEKSQTGRIVGIINLEMLYNYK